MKKNLLSAVCALMAASCSLQAATQYVQDTFIDLQGATLADGSKATAEFQNQWNTVTAATGSNAVWAENSSVTGLQLKNDKGNDSYTMSISKGGNTGVWSKDRPNMPTFPHFAVDPGAAGSGLGGNNLTVLTFGIQGFQAGDVIQHLVIGGYAQNNANSSGTANNFEVNTYRLTITGAVMAANEQLSLIQSNENFAITWETNGTDTVTLNLAVANNTDAASTDFAVDLSGLVLTGDSLDIAIQSVRRAENGGALHGLSYIGMFPEPTTCSLSLLALGLLSLRRRRNA